MVLWVFLDDKRVVFGKWGIHWIELIEFYLNQRMGESIHGILESRPKTSYVIEVKCEIDESTILRVWIFNSSLTHPHILYKQSIFMMKTLSGFLFINKLKASNVKILYILSLRIDCFFFHRIYYIVPFELDVYANAIRIHNRFLR